MKTFGGILGILGGLLGMVAFALSFFNGLITSAHPSIWLGILGETASFTCIAASIALFLGAGRLAGAGLLAAALIAMAIGMSFGVSYLVAFAVVGGMLAVMPGHKRRPSDEARERFEWETERSFGSGR